MAFVVLYDACVLYPAPLRDLLVRLANTGVVRARWSAAILDECFRNILEHRPDLKPESLQRTRELIGQGWTVERVLGESRQVVEGVPATRAAIALAQRYGEETLVELYRSLATVGPASARQTDDLLRGVLGVNRAKLVGGWRDYLRTALQ